MQHAHKIDIQSTDTLPDLDTSGWEKAAPWPRQWRVIFMIGTAAACWAAVLGLGYWLVH